MKYYDELRTEMERILQQMATTKKKKCYGGLEKVKRICKDFIYEAWMLKYTLAEDSKSK